MSEQKFIHIVNWGRFQHYKNRNPPWIKLHRELLTSRTWATSDDATRVLAIALMMLAAVSDNKIPLDLAYIRRVAYLNQDPDLSGLLATEFIEIVDGAECASRSLTDASKSNVLARPETEAETETDPPLLKESVFNSKENARARNKTYGDRDFLERDLRSLTKAREKIELKLSNGWGNNLTDDQIFEEQCIEAGLTVRRAEEVSKCALQWPARTEASV